MDRMIYLDNAATTYPKPECVYQAMDNANRRMAVNAGRGSYALAQAASEMITDTKNLILKTVQADDVAEVVFTASATLACNQILGGVAWKKTDVVYVSPYEHNAVMRSLYHQKEQYGFRIIELGINLETLALDLAKIRYQFTMYPPSVVIMTHVSNVTGYILPVSEVLAMAEEYDPIIIVDASQAFCLISMELKNEPVDFYIFAGHKTPYGPFGIGGFINNGGKKLGTYLAGGTGSDSLNLKMPEGGSIRYEPGSPNIVAIAGFKAALEELWQGEQAERDVVEGEICRIENKRIATDNCQIEQEAVKQEDGVWLARARMEQLLRQEQDLTAYLTAELSAIPEVELYLPCESRQHVGIVAFNLRGYKSEDIAQILDEDYHIAVRAGYHCAPLIHKYIRNEGSVGVVRVSVGRFSTKDEVDSLVRAVEEIVEG